MSQKRVLVSEGSSLSARQSITALGLAGHRVGVCDSNPLCLGRFSRFVTNYYRCPALGKDPWAYLDAVLELLADGGWDVLFPAHEQAFLFSRERARITPEIGLALADFQSFLRVQGEVALVRTLERFSIPQPASRVVRSRDELLRERRFPFYLKADYATASTAVWRVRSIEDLKSRSFEAECEFVVQEAVDGTLERVQAVFDRGKLVAIHGYRQMAQGMGGGDISKLSIHRPGVRDLVARLGSGLQWHGALSLDYIVGRERQDPLFIDANPRLVEPMNAVFSGINLADILVRLSCGEPVVAAEPASAETRTHMLLMALLSKAAARGRRRDVIAELIRALGGRGMYANSREELLPVRVDYRSLFPLLYALSRLLANPASAADLSSGSIAAYALSPQAAREIAAAVPGQL